MTETKNYLECYSLAHWNMKESNIPVALAQYEKCFISIK